MAGPAAASVLQALLGSTLGAAAAQDNQLSIQGFGWRPGADGMLEATARSLEASSLGLEAGGVAAHVARVALDDVTALVRTGAGATSLASLQARGAELSGLHIEGPLVLTAARGGEAAGAAALAPLAGADGTLRARITDAQLFFDADVTIPIRGGRVRFDDATVEHVGPDSRMGVSRMGFYVDAPNGRSYLYQFASLPVAGVAFERRGAFIGPWVTDRGSLDLQAFAEGLLGQGARGAAQGITQQARLLLDRTALSGEVRLGPGRVAARGVQADVAGDESGGTTVQVRSDVVGRGISAGIANLALRRLGASRGGRVLSCDAVTGSIGLRLSVEDGQMRFALDAPRLVLAGLRLQAAA